MSNTSRADFSNISMEYLDNPIVGVNLLSQEFDATKYSTVGGLVLGVLLFTGADKGDPHGETFADKQGKRSIVGLLRATITAIDPKFHQNEKTPEWVLDIQKMAIGFGSTEDGIRNRLGNILGRKHI